MKKVLFLSILICSVSFLHAQTTWDKVYNLISLNCGSCHTAGHESGLDLSGTSSEVYNEIYDVNAHNSEASDKKFKVVMPGDPYKSFLFSKINNGLALDVSLSAGEGTACPKDSAPLDNKEIEIIRQWILYGAQNIADNVDEALINDFYDNGGLQSIPSPPAAPAPEDGFQIHYGPYFLWPEDEHEYWSKFATNLPDDIEINRLEVIMGDYSHHFIIYKYDPVWNTYLFNPYGLRTNDPEFLGVSLVTANQFSYDLHLPDKTAFAWSDDSWLDLNSHYINYSSEFPLACEVYVNVYTQPSGTALYEMFSQLPANTELYIPNDGAPHTFNQAIFQPGVTDKIFVWALTSHTHKYGDDFNMYKRNADGSKGEQIFDAACGSTNGIPGCEDEIYDYQHPPIRYWDTFLPIVPKEGIYAEATYVNDGPVPVYFGLTSDDEMMVEIYFYIEDTLGLNLSTSEVTEQAQSIQQITAYPNPVNDLFYISISENVFQNNGSIQIEILDINGKPVSVMNAPTSANSSTLYFKRNNLPSGIYFIRITDESGKSISQKLIFN